MSPVAPIVGVALFLLVVAGLFAVNLILGRRYLRGRGRDRAAENTMREVALRDAMLGYPTGGSAPYPGSADPSPRDRLRSQDPEESE